ncbi:MAG: hypothetical protein LUQ65_07795 [Candidatus Helarchaeota archaeon]|nr:hypothetical protein [Candidatus Helarchaeota archaeon]
MRNYSKRLLELALVLMFFIIVPTSFAFSETREMGTTTASYTRTIFPEDHQGRIQFSFTANVSLTVSITNSAGNVTLWTTDNTSGSCDLTVDPDAIYRANFFKMPGYAVLVQYTVVEQSNIPGFELILTALILLAILGLIYLQKQQPLLPR